MQAHAAKSLLAAVALVVGVEARAFAKPEVRLQITTTSEADQEGGLMLHIENTSEQDLKDVTLSLTLAKDDGVALESKVQLRYLPAHTSVPTRVWVPGSASKARVGDIQVKAATLRSDGKKPKDARSLIAVELLAH